MVKKRRTTLLLITIILVSLIMGCSKSKEVEESVQSLRREVEVADIEELYTYRLPFIESDASIDEYIDTNQTIEKQSKLREEIEGSPAPAYVENLSKEEAIEDIEKYFTHIKDIYGGYLANGGEGRFNQAKQSIIDNLQDQMNSTQLSGLMEEAVSFVDDAHFVIGKQDTISRIKSYYYVEKLEIGKDEDGYYNLKTDDYIKNIDELEGFLKPSLNANGELCFRPIAFEEDLEDTPKVITYKDDSDLHINFTKVSGVKIRDFDPLYEDSKIPYLHIKEFYMPNEEESLEFVLQAAKDMSKAPISILDLRGNFGGNGILARQWFKEYSGEDFQTSANTVQIIGEETFRDDSSGQSWEEYMKFYKGEVYDENHIIEKASSKVIEKDNKLIVLTDTYTGSASESLLDGLRHLDNTLVIGMPTTGSSNSSRLFSTVLPNSKINYGFGNSWSIFNDEYYKEFHGFKPDIWIPYIQVEDLKNYLSNFIEE